MPAERPSSAPRSGWPRGDRPRRERSRQSWFGELDGGEAVVQGAPGDADEDAPAGRPTETFDDAEAPWAEADTRILQKKAAAQADVGPRPAFVRIHSAFMAARAALGVLLLLAQGLLSLLATANPGYLPITISLAYAALALSQWILPSRSAGVSLNGHLRRRQWLGTVGVDLVVFMVLNALAGPSNTFAALFVLPVLMGGVLTGRLPALAVAAVASISLLVIAALRVHEGGEGTVLITQAGLAGGGFLLIALLAGELAGRLAREELAARSVLEMARQQAQLNRLVIDEMQEGVLVVDRAGRVRTANPAARVLLGRPAPRDGSFRLRGVRPWDALVAAVERAFAEGAWPIGGRDVALGQAGPDGSAGARQLRVRMRFTRRRQASATEELCVMFLEDLRTVQARARQEKLAAMGRVSAGIAHEIRNPLAAIAQANALLGEDVRDPSQRRLTSMVADNVERLKRIVDDVLEVAPGAPPRAEVIDLVAQTGAILSDWMRTHHAPLGDGGPLDADLGQQPIGVRFDPDHLRRVLVNLLDNGLRHSAGSPGSVKVRLQTQGSQGVSLSVASDGPPIAADVEPYLFEPFFSTRSRGTGLGLYICRELCERYGATIDYRQLGESERHRNVFVLTMPRLSLADGEPRLELTS